MNAILPCKGSCRCLAAVVICLVLALSACVYSAYPTLFHLQLASDDFTHASRSSDDFTKLASDDFTHASRSSDDFTKLASDDFTSLSQVF